MTLTQDLIRVEIMPVVVLGLALVYKKVRFGKRKPRIALTARRERIRIWRYENALLDRRD